MNNIIVFIKEHKKYILNQERKLISNTCIKYDKYDFYATIECIERYSNREDNI